MVDVSKIGGVALNPVKAAGGGASGVADGSFGDILKNLVGQAVADQKTAETMTVAAASGGDSVSLSDVVQAVSKAELTLQTLVTVRDKAVEAYQEIMRMPV